MDDDNTNEGAEEEEGDFPDEEPESGENAGEEGWATTEDSDETDSDGDARYSDEVVATRMTNVRERVHLGVDSEHTELASLILLVLFAWGTEGELGAPGGFQAEVVRGHVEAVFGHEGGQLVVGITVGSWFLSAVSLRGAYCSWNMISG